MRKIFSILLLTVMFAAAAFPVYADTEMTNPPIVDNAGYLSSEEYAFLSQKLNEIRAKYDFDIAIYTEKELSSDTAEASADDIFDYKGYGAGDTKDGMMLYVCSGTREYHMTTHGEGIADFTDNGLKYLEKEMLPALRDNNYYGAFKIFAEKSDELLQMAADGHPYDKPQRSIAYILIVILLCLSVPLLIAFLMTKRKLSQMNTAVSNDYAEDYMKPGSMQLSDSKDIFLYSTVVRTEKPDDDSGSSTHTSSAGETHGGRGGSF